MKYFSTLLLFLLLPALVAIAQERIDPRHPNAVEFPEIGQMIGTHDSTKGQFGIGEQFGYVIEPVGDVNRDGLQDWIVGHNRVDSIQQFDGIPIPPVELLLYKGVRGRLPTVESSVRIGPTELFCETQFLSAGDFDADGNRDLVILSNFWGDTSFGHSGGIQHCYVVVYWGNQGGLYSNDDTTRLSNTAYTWGVVGSGVTGDIDHDNVDDLVLYFSEGKGLGWGEIVSVPRMHVFTGGAGQRWGRNDVSAHARLRWWAAPSGNTTPELSILDHDRDGLNDLVVIDQARNNSSNNSRITIFYGRSGRELPDTLDMERVALDIANGKSARLTDITGDGAPELVMSCGSQKTFKVFAGRPRQRLAKQYGSGYDAPIEGQGWWSRPWQVVKQPQALHDGWLPIAQMSNAPLGDANLDGLDDIWTYSPPFLLCYTTGKYLDQWADGFIYVGELEAGANLGDIDGSGVQTIALHYDQTPRKPVAPFPGGIIFIKQNRDLPTNYWDPPLRLPHLPPAGIELQAATDSRTTIPHFAHQSDPGTGRHKVTLINGTPGARYPVQVVNLLGERLGHDELSVDQASVVFDLTPGFYLVSMTTPAGNFTKPVVIE